VNTSLDYVSPSRPFELKATAIQTMESSSSSSSSPPPQQQPPHQPQELKGVARIDFSMLGNSPWMFEGELDEEQLMEMVERRVQSGLTKGASTEANARERKRSLASHSKVSLLLSYTSLT
jgi:hypothetical protein